MKTGFAIIVLLAASLQAFSQAAENDDMYFSAKDRASVNQTTQATARPDRVKRNSRNSIDDNVIAANDSRITNTSINPTDSYSARNISPEYVSRSKSAVDDTVSAAGYFSNSYSYAPVGVNKNLYNNNYSNNSFYSPYYGNNYGYGTSAYGLGGMYGPYGPYSMMGMGGMYGMNPYYSGYSSFMPGLSMGLGYGMGSMYGMGMGYGMGYGMYSPYSMMGMGMYSPYSMMGMGMYGMYGMGGMYGMYNPYGFGYSPFLYGGYGYGYPGSVYAGGGDSGRPLSYQRRADRSSSMNNTITNNYRSVNTTTRNGRSISSSNGRVSSSGAQAQNYYQRGWRNNGTVTTNSRSSWNTGSGYNNTNTNAGRTRSWGGNSGFNNGGSSYGRTGNAFGGSNSGSTWGGGSNSRSSWGSGNSSFGSTPSFGGGSRGSFGGGGGGSFGGGGGGGGGARGGRH